MPEIRLREYIAKIKALIRQSPDEAIAHCRHILRSYPTHLETYSLLGQACLAREMLEAAGGFFRRTLSADPENLVAWMGLSKVCDEQGMLFEAIWPLERAFELAPSNNVVRQELQNLYARRDGVSRVCLSLAPCALGRFYARNGLYAKAVEEFRTAIGRDPDSPATHVALSEALWHEGRHTEAAACCLDILQRLPNCFKANLILGAIRIHRGQNDAGEARLHVARCLDPENLLAQQIMGDESPLRPVEVTIAELETEVAAGVAQRGVVEDSLSEEPPDWLEDLQKLEARAGSVIKAEERKEGAGHLELEETLSLATLARVPTLAEVPGSLLVLVEAGLMDAGELEARVAELVVMGSEAQRVQAISCWLGGLIDEEDAISIAKALGPQAAADEAQGERA